MIKLIGFQRIVLLSALLILNLLVAVAYFAGVEPMLEEQETQKSSISGQIASLKSQIASVQADVKFVNENKPKYDSLKEKGFFDEQDAFRINHMLEGLRTKEDISSFSFSTEGVQTINNADADKVNYNLLNSRIKVDRIATPVDNNVYKLAQDISHSFPVYTRIQSLEVTRSMDVTEQALKDIQAGKPVSFVNANIVLDWMTMAKKPSAPAGTPGGAGGFRGR